MSEKTGVVANLNEFPMFQIGTIQATVKSILSIVNPVKLEVAVDAVKDHFDDYAGVKATIAEMKTEVTQSIALVDDYAKTFEALKTDFDSEVAVTLYQNYTTLSISLNKLVNSKYVVVSELFNKATMTSLIPKTEEPVAKA